MDAFWAAFVGELKAKSLPEVIAFAVTLAAVWLTIRNVIWNWPLGIISAVIYGYVFYASHLYSSAILQIGWFLPMQFYGWWVWLRGGPERSDDLPVTLLSPGQWAFTSGGAILIWIGLGAFMSRQAGVALPWLDAAQTAVSIVAYYLQAHKKLENWAMWVGVNMACAFDLYPAQKLYLTSVLYFLLLLLAFKGWAEWRRILRQKALSPA